MTIAKRLIILLTVPLVALVGLGVFTRLQLAQIEARSRFVAESRIVALATLGNLSRSFAELRVNVRSHLLATDDAQRAAARAAVRRGRTGREPPAAGVRGRPGPRRQGPAAARRIPDAEPRVDCRREAGHVAGG